MKTEECKRLQEQQTAFSALVSTLEADLSAANASMSDVRSMVMENSHAMKEQKAWIQKSMVREEHLVGKPVQQKSDDTLKRPPCRVSAFSRQCRSLELLPQTCPAATDEVGMQRSLMSLWRLWQQSGNSTPRPKNPSAVRLPQLPHF